ncbi:MAG TPA: serine--tRNA ligase, partial [Usitatibacter sp.]|nr:serine--tRNA ligase [Usitatibacter sp.]
MLDIQLLRKDLPAVVAGLKRRGFDLDVAAFQKLEDERKKLQLRTEELQAKRNALNKQVGMLKGKGEDASGPMKEAAGIGDELKANEAALAGLQQRASDFLRVIPNIPRPEVPDGRSSDDNVEVRRWGEPRQFDFPVKDHVDVGVGLGGLDFETAAKLSGARFSVLRGAVARLHRALAQFMLQVHTEEHGYTEVYVPYMVTAECADGVSSLAKFKDDLFKVEGRDLYLIPTAEYPVTNFVRDEIVDAARLPLRFACHSPCFRSEAGSYGKDTRGMIRQHQFDKVEIVQMVRPEDSAEAHEGLTRNAEAILQKLELPYRVMLLCTGDMGFSSAKTYDLEVWLPGQ